MNVKSKCLRILVIITLVFNLKSITTFALTFNRNSTSNETGSDPTYMFTDGDGNRAFCVTKGAEAPNSNSCKEDTLYYNESVRAGLGYILDQYSIIVQDIIPTDWTQQVIHKYLYEKASGQTNLVGKLSKMGDCIIFSTNQKTTCNYAEWLAEAESEYDRYKGTIKLSSNTLNFTESGNNYIATVDISQGKTLYSLTEDNLNVNVGSVSLSDNTITVTVPKTSINVETTVTLTVSYTKTYRLPKVYSCGTTSKEKSIQHMISLGHSDNKEKLTSATASGKINPFTNYTIYKKNLNGIGISGAKVSLYSNSSCSVAVKECTSYSDGSCTFLGVLANDNYYYKETNAPSGYELDSTCYKLSTNSTLKNKTTCEAKFDNLKATGKLTRMNRIRLFFELGGVNYQLLNFNETDTSKSCGTERNCKTKINLGCFSASLKTGLGTNNTSNFDQDDLSCYYDIVGYSKATSESHPLNENQENLYNFLTNGSSSDTSYADAASNNNSQNASKIKAVGFCGYTFNMTNSIAGNKFTQSYNLGVINSGQMIYGGTLGNSNLVEQCFVYMDSDVIKNNNYKFIESVVDNYEVPNYVINTFANINSQPILNDKNINAIKFTYHSNNENSSKNVFLFQTSILYNSKIYRISEELVNSNDTIGSINRILKSSDENSSASYNIIYNNNKASEFKLDTIEDNDTLNLENDFGIGSHYIYVYHNEGDRYKFYTYNSTDDYLYMEYLNNTKRVYTPGSILSIYGSGKSDTKIDWEWDAGSANKQFCTNDNRCRFIDYGLLSKFNESGLVKFGFGLYLPSNLLNSVRSSSNTFGSFGDMIDSNITYTQNYGDYYKFVVNSEACSYTANQQIVTSSPNGDFSKLNLEFRIIDTSNPFPGKTGTNTRKVGSNWCSDESTKISYLNDDRDITQADILEIRKAISEKRATADMDVNSDGKVDEKDLKIYRSIVGVVCGSKDELMSNTLNCTNDNLKTCIYITNANNSYDKTKDGPIYKISLTPETINKIKKYNNENKSYDYWDLTCEEVNISGNYRGGNNCKTKFFNDHIEEKDGIKVLKGF